MKEKLAKRFHEMQHIVGLTAFLCALICLSLGLARSPALYPVDYGQYERILESCGLTWTEEDLADGSLQYERPINRFAYTRFSWSELLSPGVGTSMAYAVAAVRVFTEPFGLPFTTDALAVVWGVLLAAACGVTSSALYRLGLRAWFLPGIVLCALFADNNFCAVLRGLYPQSADIVFGLLLTAFTLYSFCKPRKNRMPFVIPTALLSALFLKSETSVIIFLPLILALNGYLFWTCRKASSHRRMVMTVCMVMLFCFCRSAGMSALTDPDYFSHAASYESAFNGMLTAADDPEAILNELGLDETYRADIGKSYYEPEESYVHCPRNQAEAERLFERVSPGRILVTYLRHPDILFRLLLRTDSQLKAGFESTRNRTLTANSQSFSAVRGDGGLPALLWRLMPLGESAFLTAIFLLLAATLLLLTIRRRVAYGLIAMMAASFLLYLPCSVVFNGLALSQQYMLFQVLLTILLLTGLLCGIIQVYPRFREWMLRYSLDAEPLPCRTIPAALPESGTIPPVGAFRRTCLAALNNRRLIILVFCMISAMMLVTVFAPKDHPVSINNGDFGRMMIQMDLTWDGLQYYDTATQAGRRAIEDFVFTQPFRPLKLTPLEPTYSLYWFVSAARLLTELFGRPFSTWILAWVMGFVSIVCLLKMLWDLQPFLKRWTVPLAVIGCALLFSETYLTWYNSLYGEGSILSGLLLTMMCAVHLTMTPPKTNRHTQIWLIGLALSLNILITSKSQMLLALPGAVGLFLWLSWHHRAWRYDLRIIQSALCAVLCVVLVFSAVEVYQTDRTSDSVSQKHTMWQAYFYGIFMISDDPIGDMRALGVDTAMAPDIGKFVQFDNDEGYVYAPLSEETQTAFYDHVSMGTIVQWYLTHPAKLWYMLNYAAGESRELYTGFRVYRGQDYSDPQHDRVNGFNLWPSWRKYLTPGTFFGYLIIYGAMLIAIFRRLFNRRKKTPPEEKIRWAVPLFLIITGVLQYPLSVLGNGFADNQKQLFCFALCHDMLTGVFLVLTFRYLAHHMSGRQRRHHGKNMRRKGQNMI